MQKVIAEFRPEVVHVHNTFAALSPSVLWVAKRQGAAGVLTVHNYRLMCATATLLRDGTPCQDCVGRWAFAAIRHNCEFSSSAAIVACTAVGQVFHRILRTYNRTVDAFIALTGFQRDLLIRSGFPAERIHGIIVHALRRGVPFANGTVDVVYHSQLLEHIDREDAAPFLRECCRVLMPGGILPIVVPNLETTAREYVFAFDRMDAGVGAPTEHGRAIEGLFEQLSRRKPAATRAQRPTVRLLKSLLRRSAPSAGKTHRWM